MPRNSGSERRSAASRLPLMLLSAAAVGSALLFASMPAEGLPVALRVLGLLPLQLAVLFWVLPRRR